MTEPLKCEQCGSTEGVELESSRTMYPQPTPTRFDLALEELPPDPNAPILFCRDCAAEHHENWDQTWADYYNGLL